MDGAAGSARRDRLCAAFAGLDDARVRWLLLRGDPDGADAELDLLVHPADLAAAETALDSVEFVRLPAIGHFGHRFYVGFDPAAGRLTLDVVSDIAFGPKRGLVLPVIDDVLARRVAGGIAPVAAPADAFWLRSLHALVDRGEMRASDRKAIEAARVAADDVATSPVASALRTLAPAAAATLARPGADVGVDDPAVSELRRLGAKSASRISITSVPGARKAFTAVRRPGIAIALLGPDGAGKSTVSTALAGRLPVPARTIYLGLYGRDSRAGRVGTAWRIGRLVRARAVTSLHRRRGRVVILDRHPIELTMPPASGRRRPGRRASRQRLLATLAPHADLLVVLDAPAEVLAARKSEHPVAELADMRERYRALATREGAVVVDTTQPVENVADEIARAAWRRLTEGWRRG